MANSFQGVAQKPGIAAWEAVPNDCSMYVNSLPEICGCLLGRSNTSQSHITYLVKEEYTFITPNVHYVSTIKSHVPFIA